MCSTPVGVDDGITPFMERITDETNKCSTPVGVDDGITTLGLSGLDFEAGTQRLSASMMESPKRSRTPWRACRKCSTPVGVDDGITTLDYLAALCHRVCSTPVGVDDGIT